VVQGVNGIRDIRQRWDLTEKYIAGEAARIHRLVVGRLGPLNGLRPALMPGLPGVVEASSQFM